jgi:hypothetical protein
MQDLEAELARWKRMLAADRRRVKQYREQARLSVTAAARAPIERAAQFWTEHAAGMEKLIAAREAQERPPEKSLLPTSNELYRSIMAAMRGGPTY